MSKKINYQITLREHIEKWKLTRLTQAEYCRNNGIPVSSFSSVKSQLKKSNKKKSNFVEIPIHNKSNSENQPLLDFKLERDFSVSINLSSEIIKSFLEFVNVSR